MYVRFRFCWPATPVSQLSGISIFARRACTSRRFDDLRGSADENIWFTIEAYWPFISAGCYSRGTADDASADEQAHWWAWNSLTVVTESGPHESNADRVRPVSFLRLRGWSLQRGLRDARATVRARVIKRLERLAPLLFSRHMGHKIALAIGCPCA